VSAGQLSETLTQLVLHLPPRPPPGPSGLVKDLISSSSEAEQLVQTLSLGAPSGPGGSVADLLFSSFHGGDHSISRMGGREHDFHWDHGRKPGCTGGCRGEGLKAYQFPSMESMGDDIIYCTGTDASSVRLASCPPKNDQDLREKEKDREDLARISMEGDQVGFGKALAGAEGSPLPGASPMAVEMRVEGQPRRGAPRTQVAITRASETVMDMYPLPSQSTLVEALRAELKRAQALGVRLLVVHTPAWFPKALVKASSRFHGVALFDRIRRLHCEAAAGKTDLVLVGVPDQNGSAALRNRQLPERASGPSAFRD
jgi:hypothetical protein